MRDNDIRFTEESNAIDYLEKTYYFLDLAKQRPINWKWVILALHGALYGFAICALKGVSTNQQENSSKGKCLFTRRNLDDLDAIYMKNGKLVALDDALNKCKDPNIMNAFLDSQPLSMTEQQKQSIKKMKGELRNNFEHFIPKIWIVSIEDLPRISNEVLDVIYFLAIETKANVHVLKKRQKIEKLISDCKLILEKQSHSATPYPPEHHQSPG